MSDNQNPEKEIKETEKIESKESNQTQPIQPTEDQQEGESISGLVNQDQVNKLIEMGYSRNVSEKAMFLNQNILEKAIEWIYENQNEPDFEEELRMIGQKKSKMTEEEIKQKAKELQAYARKKYLQKEKERAEEQERNRIRMTKDLAIAKREMEDAENKRFIEQQKRKKQEEEKAKREMIEQLERDKAERFGKEYKSNIENKKKSNPIDDCKYYIEAIVKLYPVFRCGDQAKTCLNTIKVIISNIIKSPDEEKFQKIKMTNQNIVDRIGKIPLAIKLLVALGFKEDGEYYIYSIKDNELLKSVVIDIDNQISKIK